MPSQPAATNPQAAPQPSLQPTLNPTQQLEPARQPAAQQRPAPSHAANLLSARGASKNPDKSPKPIDAANFGLAKVTDRLQKCEKIVEEIGAFMGTLPAKKARIAGGFIKKMTNELGAAVKAQRAFQFEQQAFKLEQQTFNDEENKEPGKKVTALETVQASQMQQVPVSPIPVVPTTAKRQRSGTISRSAEDVDGHTPLSEQQPPSWLGPLVQTVSNEMQNVARTVQQSMLQLQLQQ
eukprot:1142317-Prorocentrum_minimum.AAC.1